MNNYYKKVSILLFLLLLIACGGNTITAQELNLSNNVIDNLYSPYLPVNKNTFAFTNINLYDISGNPAMLILSGKKTNMKLGYLNGSDRNDFRRPFDEKKKSTNKGYVNVTYIIDTLQAIHSFISFNDEQSSDKRSLFNRYPYRGNPYTLGDNSEGKFDLQMLTIETDYSRKISEDFTVGAEFTYNVGNSVRRSFPKPTADYLELGGRLGIAYEIGENLIAGLFGDYFRTYEEINYSANYTSPTVYKFRGYDYPFLLLGTSSLTRRNEDDGIGGGFELKYFMNEKFTVLLSGKALTNEEKVTDGITVNPKLQGRWKQNNGEGFIAALYGDEKIELRAGAVIEIDRQFASRPNLDESILTKREYSFSGFAGVKYFLLPELKIHGLYQMISRKLEVKDYINYIEYDVPSLSHNLSGGINYAINEYFETGLEYTAMIYSPDKKEISTREPADFYYLYFLPEIEYYQTSFFCNSINANIVYHYGILGDLGLNLNMNFLNSDNKGIRNSFNINAYINLFIF